MKLSLKTRDQQQHNNPLVRAKIPISVLGLPFVSGIVAGDPSDLSFSLRSNFPSGPSLKLSYTPCPSTSTAPFTLSLNSGVGLFGSPNNSPLRIAAHFSLFPNAHRPTFSLQIKPQFGDFSLKKSTFSPPFPNANPSANGAGVGFVPLERPVVVPNPNSSENSGMHSGCGDGFVPFRLGPDLKPKENAGVFSNGGSGIGFFPERPLAWRDLRMDSCCGKDGILSGFALRARTVLPVMKGVVMNFRWGVNFPAEFGKSMPFLTVDKFGIERLEDAKEVKVKRSDGDRGDVELLKGMCFWMSRDLEALQKENGEMKQKLEELRSGFLVRNHSRELDGIGKKLMPSSFENPSQFEQWRGRKNGREDNGRRETDKAVNRASDVESELQKAIKVASS
ncbi:uncharacterized protein LOC131164471 [Malania oleifera]|uniref:uncharacterized protein LOC131164471 n=1 Tax=Malania oleifera TaxID=397392 RepID=UPI0025AEAE43|nr:uncharacterized protein LOC131164471 [Malania oleifera]